MGMTGNYGSLYMQLTLAKLEYDGMLRHFIVNWL